MPITFKRIRIAKLWYPVSVEQSLAFVKPANLYMIEGMQPTES